jgi:sulfate adenylyltransferase
MIKINLNFRQYLELEKLGDGALDPVFDFMIKKEVLSVAKNVNYKGKIFPLPIVLDITKKNAKRIKNEDYISLFFKKKLVGKIFKPEVFTLDKKMIAKKIYGTNSLLHPGVYSFLKQSDYYLGGKTKFLKRVKNTYSKYEITPIQSKSFFKKNSLKTIVGFQTRNVPHKAHEYLIRNAMENYDCIFIQPLLGEKKIGDYKAHVIMESFKILIKEFLNKKKVLLGSLLTFMRYAGPREALFHAIIRRNYGCTHFIVGRDHAGVSNFYTKYEAQKFVKKYEQKIGIKILYSTGPFYCSKCKIITTEKICTHNNYRIDISGTYIRNIFSKGEKVDQKLINKIIVDTILKNIKKIFLYE